MRVVGIIFLIVIAVAVLGNMGDSDDPKAAPSAATVKAGNKKAKVDELTTRGQEIANEIIALAQEGVELTNAGDAAGACGVVDEQISKLDELSDVVEGLRPIVPASTMTKLDDNETDLRVKIGNTEAVCNGMGL